MVWAEPPDRDAPRNGTDAVRAVAGVGPVCDDAGPFGRKEEPMASRLNPYISFKDNARQAMEFYRDVFGGELRMSTFGEFGAAGTPHADNIMHAVLETDNGFTLMASDTPPGMEHNPGTNISVSLSGEDAAELRGYWDKLSSAGTVSVPLEKQMWGDEFGMVQDQFGVAWLVNISQQPA
jgi:PhnB protein